MDPWAYGTAATGLPPAGPEAGPEPRRARGRVVAAVLVLAFGFGAAALGLATAGGSGSAPAAAAPGSGASPTEVKARAAWRSAPADKILPPAITREGDETYYRLAVDPDENCAQLPPAFLKALAPAGCTRLIQATYLDSTESLVATAGFVVVGGTSAQQTALFQNWTADAYARQYSMMPSAYPVPATVASTFQNPQRIAWKSAVSTDGAYIAFTVAGFADGRQGPAAAAFAAGNASELQSDAPPVQVAVDLPTSLLADIAAYDPTANGSQS